MFQTPSFENILLSSSQSVAQTLDPEDFLARVDTLSALGHEVSVTQNWFSEVGETNIIFGAELIADWVKLPRNSILFNLEQPSHPNMAKVRALAQGLEVWDFSRRNVADWQRLGSCVARC